MLEKLFLTSKPLDKTLMRDPSREMKAIEQFFHTVLYRQNPGMFPFK